MKPRLFRILVVSALGLVWTFLPQPVLGKPAKDTIILSPENPSWTEAFAAREVRRYVYARTGILLPIRSEVDESSIKGEIILIARRDRPVLTSINDSEIVAGLASLAPQGYWLKTVSGSVVRIKGQKPQTGKSVLLLTGADHAGTLYAAYRFAEILGVRFYLHGDVIPDEQSTWSLPVLDERKAPLFALRGIQPFHDFPEGPDWWNQDDYLAVIGQLPKLRMNFIGLHTYPEDRPNAEPTVWIGVGGDVGKKQRVQFSYPSSYQNTLRGNWGYGSTKTSDYLFGSAGLFDEDKFGANVMTGAIPSPMTGEANNRVFARTAEMLNTAFGFARRLEVKTCVGTETPLVIPKLVRGRLATLGKDPSDASTTRELYEGIFRRAAQAYPLDYFWLWTPEGWTWSGVKEEEIIATTNDLFAAISARRNVQAPFRLATCGWVLGPTQDRAMFDKVLPKDMAVSCINRQVGYAPVERGFAEVKGRPKWAIPWLEDDPALTSPQLWVGRMRRDAADALRYGCDGLMGIHWRTRVLGPNVSALARLAWEQPPPPEPVAGPVGGEIADFPSNAITGTEEPGVYQSVRYNVSAYHLPATNGICRVRLKFCEPFYDARCKRVFDVKLQGQSVITNLDIFAAAGKNRALDFTYDDVPVTNGWLDIDFVPRVEFPSIAGIEVNGNGFSAKINCGGPAYRDYAADLPLAAYPDQLFVKPMYEDWAIHEFGSEAGRAAATIFARVDGRLPIPSVWTDGPGGIKPDSRGWGQVRTDYLFVDEFAALRPLVHGAGNLERFDYWLNMLQYLRAIGELNCAWGEYNRELERVKNEKDPVARKALARESALPARARLVQFTGAVFEHLLATVSTPGELGTVANWNQHNVPALLTGPGEELARILGDALPASCQTGRHYRGPTRIVVPTKRTTVAANEPLKLKVLLLAENAPRSTAIYWRKLGLGRFEPRPLWHVARGVYQAELPPNSGDDFEYYIKVEPNKGPAVYFPATAPQLNQIVVVYPSK
jgi:hypothetical protein